MIARRLSFPEAHVPHLEGMSLGREIMIHLESAAAKMSLDDGGRATLLHLGYLRGICSRSNTLNAARPGSVAMPATPPDALRAAATGPQLFHRASDRGSASAPADAQPGDAAAIYN